MELKRILLAIAVTSGLGATGAAVLAAPAAAAISSAAVVAADDDDDDDDDGRGSDDDQPKGGVDTGKGGTARVDDDDDQPRGGVETGAGGTWSEDGMHPAVPIGLAGAAAAVAGGAVWLRRRSGAES